MEEEAEEPVGGYNKRKELIQNQPYQQPPLYQPPVYAEKNYTTNAVWVMLLYLVLYIPGLIANVAYLADALNTKQRVGHNPQGLGCLQALLLLQVIPCIIAVILIVSAAASH